MRTLFFSRRPYPTDQGELERMVPSCQVTRLEDAEGRICLAIRGPGMNLRWIRHPESYLRGELVRRIEILEKKAAAGDDLFPDLFPMLRHCCHLYTLHIAPGQDREAYGEMYHELGLATASIVESGSFLVDAQQQPLVSLDPDTEGLMSVTESFATLAAPIGDRPSIETVRALLPDFEAQLDEDGDVILDPDGEDPIELVFLLEEAEEKALDFLRAKFMSQSVGNPNRLDPRILPVLANPGLLMALQSENPDRRPFVRVLDALREGLGLVVSQSGVFEEGDRRPLFVGDPSEGGPIAKVGEADLLEPEADDPFYAFGFEPPDYDPASSPGAVPGQGAENEGRPRQREISDRQKARFERTRDLLRAKAVPEPTDFDLYTVDDGEAVMRRPEEVAKRVLILLVVALRAEGMTMGELGHILVNDHYDIRHAVSPEERAFLANETPDPEEAQMLVWRYEGIQALLWALGHVSELPWPSGMADMQHLMALLQALAQDPEFVEQSVMRPRAQILDALDLTYRQHWALRQCYVDQAPTPADFDWTSQAPRVAVGEGPSAGVLFERHRALNWLTGFDGAEWDDVDTPT